MKLVCGECGTINQLAVETLDGDPNCGLCHQSMFSGRPIEVNTERLIKHVDNSELPVLVDFWAPWCGPCLQFAPILDEFTSRVGHQLRILKLNTQANEQASIDFNIRSIPTIAVFLNGEEKGRTSGGLAIHHLQQWVLQQLQD